VTEARPRQDAAQPDGPDRAGVLDLLGLLAYAELVAFFRLSGDAALAPSLADKAALGEMAVAEFGHFQLLWEHITALGAQPDQAWSRRTSAMASRRTSTARWPSWSTRRPATWCSGCWPTPGTPSS
jgi:1,2-phenylacetyl-CoA epoxidase catalytic subunit